MGLRDLLSSARETSLRIIAKRSKDPVTNRVLLRMLEREAERAGFRVNFRGKYMQGNVIPPGPETLYPFIIAQTPGEELRLIKEGYLEGITFEHPSSSGPAIVRGGRLTPKTIEFEKVYKLSKTNKASIKYVGTSNDGLTYTGTWSFDTDQIATSKMATASTRGTFMIRLVKDRFPLEEMRLLSHIRDKE